MNVCVQLRFLVQWGLGGLEEAASHTGAFTLLRGILGRGIVLPEVYDVMTRVEQLMIRTQVGGLRRLHIVQFSNNTVYDTKC